MSSGENLQLQEEKNDITQKQAEIEKMKANVCARLMLLATGIYLIFGFICGRWGMPYVLIFPVFGVLCVIVSVIIDIKGKIHNENK